VVYIFFIDGRIKVKIKMINSTMMMKMERSSVIVESHSKFSMIVISEFR
jgi:hypothetical protein